MRPGQYADSVRLDQELRDSGGPAFTPWHEFSDWFDFDQGEHVTLVGTTGSGKTTLARELLLPQREYVCVLATKMEDDSLYLPLMAAGYEVVESFNPTPEGDEPRRVIFRPPLYEPTTEALNEQAEAFRKCLVQIYQHGRWAVYADEERYLTETLKLRSQFNVLYLQGRSQKTSIIGATQRPVSIPLEAFDQATHLFLWRNTDRYNVQRMAEFAGADVSMVRQIIPQLPQHEFLYIDTRSGYMTRSKVVL